MVDSYTRIILTIIALTLIVIAAKLGSPQPAYAVFGGGPTLGDITNADNSEEKRKILMEAPLVVPMQ